MLNLPLRSLILATTLALAASGPVSAQIIGPPGVEPGQEHCVINVADNDRLNLRSAPSARADVLTTYFPEECGLLVTGACADDWCPLNDGRRAGWASARYLGAVNPPFFCGNGEEGAMLSLRAGPADTAPMVAEIPTSDCDIAALPFAKAGWLKVRLGDGREGWVTWDQLYAQ